ncbi:PASTA domain-containing protein [Microbacterium sp. No. 7]|uniref:PASTA domain-containing protein n=1 Tax=Microbacterium sp. No. 7 TaxID=1714373 RepID=UPI003009B75A
MEVREFWPLDERFDDYLMPDVVGMHLDEAKELLEEWDPYLNEEDASGDGRRSWADGNWTVVSQDPLPGKPQRAGQGVDLGILKHEEVGDSLADLPREDRHVYDRVFAGTVTAHGEYVRNLTVDGAEIQLDLIAPVAESCGTELDDGTDTAYSAQLETIPLNARVLVVRSEQGDDRAFVHVLEGEQITADPPLESANEALVRTGWWSPESTRFDGGFGENRDQSISFDVWNANRSQLSETQAKYAPLIAAAGNEEVDASTAGLGLCRDAAEAEAERWVARQAELKESIRQWTIEYERRLREGYYSCRDGDGDGICYER